MRNIPISNTTFFINPILKKTITPFWNMTISRIVNTQKFNQFNVFLIVKICVLMIKSSHVIYLFNPLE